MANIILDHAKYVRDDDVMYIQRANLRLVPDLLLRPTFALVPFADGAAHSWFSVVVQLCFRRSCPGHCYSEVGHNQNYWMVLYIILPRIFLISIVCGYLVWWMSTMFVSPQWYRRHSSPTASIPTPMWGRCIRPVASTQPSFVYSRPIVHSSLSISLSLSLSLSFSLSQFNFYTVHPPPLQSSFPSPLLHIHPHHLSIGIFSVFLFFLVVSCLLFPHIFFTPSHDISAPL